jgi:hypothetical protein
MLAGVDDPLWNRMAAEFLVQDSQFYKLRSIANNMYNGFQSLLSSEFCCVIAMHQIYISLKQKTFSAMKKV